VYAVAGVDDVIRRDDAEKEAILRPMFGDEWALARAFPTRRVQDGERVTIGSVAFRVVDVGPAESPHDSWWVLESGGAARVFPGDLVYNHMHAYLADGFSDQWLAALARAKRDLPADVELCVGHGPPARGHAILDWQSGYIEEFLEAVRAADRDGLRDDPLVEAVARRMRAYLPSEDLEFLMRLSVEPNRVRLASSRRASGPADRE
jgi:glyoxylase-like metal-dependent hydrolase (beta-lactamase superfamily II)